MLVWKTDVDSRISVGSPWNMLFVLCPFTLHFRNRMFSVGLFAESPMHRYLAFNFCRGWSGGAMALGKLPVPGRPTIWITVGQGPTALAVGAGGGCLDIFTLIYPFSPLSPSLWETARYRLQYCLKGPFNPKQPTNQLLSSCVVCLYVFLQIWNF